MRLRTDRFSARLQLAPHLMHDSVTSEPRCQDSVADRLREKQNKTNFFIREHLTWRAISSSLLAGVHGGASICFGEFRSSSAHKQPSPQPFREGRSGTPSQETRSVWHRLFLHSQTQVPSFCQRCHSIMLSLASIALES